MPSLFSDRREGWEEIGRDEAVEHLSSRLGTDERSFLSRSQESLEGSVRVRRQLSCYPGWSLYELKFHTELLSEALELEQRPGKALAYILVSEERAFFLTGKSTVIYGFNSGERDGGKGSSLTLDTEEARLEYLEIFCQAVASEEGPFSILFDEDDIDWKAESETEEYDIHEIVERRRIEHGWQAPPIEVPAEIVVNYLTDDQVRESFDAETAAPMTSEVTENRRPLRRRDVVGFIEEPKRTEAPSQAPSSETPPESIKELLTNAIMAAQSAGAAAISATVIHDAKLSRSYFKVYQSGYVEMVADEPILPGQNNTPRELHARRRRYHPEHPILLTQNTRRPIPPDDFIERFLQAGEEDKRKSRPISNIIVTGTVDLTGRSISRCRMLNDVIIDGDFILDDARSETSLEMRKMRITGRLQARNLRCSGALDLRDLQVYGMHQRGIAAMISLERRAILNLRGSKIGATLDLSNALSVGGVDLSEIQVEGRGIFNGMEVRIREPLENADGGHRGPEDLISFSLRNARFGGSVSFTDETTGLAWLLRDKKTKIHGTLALHGARIEGFLMAEDLEIKARYWATDPSSLSEERRKQFAELVKNNVVTGRINPKTRRLMLTEPRQQGGDLDLRNLHARDGVRADQVSVEGNLDASGLVSENMAIELRGAQIGRLGEQDGKRFPDGSLRLGRSRIGGLELGPGVEQGNQHFARILGSLELTEAQATGSIRLRGAKILGALQAERLECQGAVDGSMYNNENRTTVGEQINFSSSDIGGSVTFDGVQIGAEERPADFSIRHANIAENVGLRGAFVSGSLRCPSSNIGGIFDACSSPHGVTKILKDVIFSGAQISSDLKLESADIGGAVMMITGSFSRIFLRPTPRQTNPTADQEKPHYEYRQTQIGGFVAHSVSMHSLNLSYVIARGIKGDAYGASIDIDNCQVDANIQFYQHRPDRSPLQGARNTAHAEAIAACLPDPAKIGCSVPDDLSIRDVRAGGDVDLTNLDAGGALRIHRCSFGGLNARSRLPKIRHGGKYCGDYSHKAQYSPDHRLTLNAASIDAEHVTVRSDVDLSGLSIIGAVHAPNLTVEGALKFVSFNEDSDVTVKHAIAAIGGKLELRRLNAESLSLSGDSFASHPDTAPKRLSARPWLREPYEGYWRIPRGECLILERSTIGKLSLYGPPPRYADLQEVHVDLVECAVEKEPQRQTDRRTIDMLRFSEPFSRQFYVMMETVYRNEGQDSEADRIYREMRWRSVSPGEKPLPVLWWQFFYGCFCRLIGLVLAPAAMLLPWYRRRSWQTLLGLFTGFWTRPSRLLIFLLLVTTPMSLAIYALPQNITPSTAHLGEETSGKTRDHTPTAIEWSEVEIGRTWMHTHVPIAPIVSGRRWQPAENRPLLFTYPAILEDNQLTRLASPWIPAWLAQPFVTDQCRTRKAKADDAPAGPPIAQPASMLIAGLEVEMRTACNENLSPAGYALIVSLLHWIAWPIFLIGASGFIQRRG